MNSEAHKTDIREELKEILDIADSISYGTEGMISFINESGALITFSAQLTRYFNIINEAANDIKNRSSLLLTAESIKNRGLTPSKQN